MHETTIQRLNAINRAFYAQTASDFDQTRGQAWPGWLKLFDSIGLPESVLDVGCGNGRFGLFLAEQNQHSQHKTPLHYHGVDNSPALLGFAESRLRSLPGIVATLEERDVIESPSALAFGSGSYDLVALFGVMHHIPGAVRRLEFMRQLAARVKPGGALAFATWRFYEQARFRDRITPWPDDLANQIEPHDYLLDWRRGGVSLRYCHYVDDAEHDALVAVSGLTEITRYRADGETGDANCYSILRAGI